MCMCVKFLLLKINVCHQMQVPTNKRKPWSLVDRSSWFQIQSVSKWMNKQQWNDLCESVLICKLAVNNFNGLQHTSQANCGKSWKTFDALTEMNFMVMMIASSVLEHISSRAINLKFPDSFIWQLTLNTKRFREVLWRQRRGESRKCCLFVF